MRLRQAAAVVRDALAYPMFARIPVSYTVNRSAAPMSSMPPSTTGLRAHRTVGTLFSIIDLLSTSTAQVEWTLYRKGTKGKAGADKREEVTAHAALSLWNKPNPYMSRYEFVQRSQQFIDLVGECFWVVERAGSTPIALWPVRPDRMKEVQSADNYLSGWVYRGPDGQDVPLGTDDVIHLMTPDPNNQYRGISPVGSLTTDLESVTLSGQFARAFFLNSARPGGIIEAPTTLSDQEFKDLTDRWREGHQGVVNAHRVGLLENGLKWRTIESTMKDMEFVELRNLSRELIREAYRINEHMLGLSANVNRATATAAGRDFARWNLVPRLERMQLALNEVLLPLFGATGKGVEFGYVSPVDEDSEVQNSVRDSKVAAAVALVSAGYDSAQVLVTVGLPPMDWTQPPAFDPFGGPPDGGPAELPEPEPARKGGDPMPPGSYDKTGPAPLNGRTNGHRPKALT
jgi:HK97 family phage portal protein